MTTKKKKPSADELRAQLAEIEATERKERRTKLVANLVAVRGELKIKRREFEKLAKKIFNAQPELDAIHRNMMSVIAAQGYHAAGRPAVCDFLPNEPEAVQWFDGVRTLNERLEELKKAKQTLGNIELLRIEAIGIRERVQQLEFAESDFINQLQNSSGVDRVGGVFAPQ
ncbi:MAG: hypothetical protein WCF30_03980 [Terracidiphilus sp.]